jgi:pimeloyl-ACP methyl ester carboxylesterase
MLERHIESRPFFLTVMERVYNKGGDADVYIEGDGVAWVGKHSPSLDPTPRNPVALHLATMDKAQNVIYMARPCQYSKMLDDQPCDPKYWTSDRFSGEVIAAMNNALNDVKLRYGFKKFNLVGFSGGAAVAVLMAAGRDDIASIRTVSGNLDHNRVNAMHNVSMLSNSLDPLTVAPKLAGIPQDHFIGEYDQIITPAIYDSFRRAAGNSSCMRSFIVKGPDHENGWAERWPQLLTAPLDCSKYD